MDGKIFHIIMATLLAIQVAGCATNPYGDKAVSLGELEGVWRGYGEARLYTTRVGCSLNFPISFKVSEGRAASLRTGSKYDFDVALKNNGGIKFIWKKVVPWKQLDTSINSFKDVDFTGQLSTAGVGQGTFQVSGCVGEWKVTRQSSDITEAAENTPRAYRVVFTTGISEDKNPINDLTKISISEKRMYVFSRWTGLKLNKTHKLTSKIFDDSGTLLLQSQYDFTPKKSNWNVWNNYKLDQHTDKPGRWKFEIYLDDIKRIDKTLTVLP